ncbi:MAG: hypothetical protein QOI80_2863 [Solirubrobacteraceae bacterium]|nr:hypothetical protein [Solirubrobacteraceae bacterium]
MRARLLLVLVAALALSGCTTEREGKVGDTLKAGWIEAKLLRYVPAVPRRKGHDVTGLSVPSPGHHFAGFDVALCNNSGLAVIPFHFELELADGDGVRPRTPETVYPNAFEPVRDDCERGWIVFEVPEGGEPETLEYKFDDTGGGGQYDRHEEHARFDWSL